MTDTKLGPEVLAELKAKMAAHPEHIGDDSDLAHDFRRCGRCSWEMVLMENRDALIAAAERCGELEAELESAWIALGITREDREENDDPDCETLAQCIAVYVQYERDKAEASRDALAAKVAEVSADLARVTAQLSAAEADRSRLLDLVDTAAVAIRERDRMRPVVEAAVRWETDRPSEETALANTVAAYLASEPKEKA